MPAEYVELQDFVTDIWFEPIKVYALLMEVNASCFIVRLPFI